MSAPTLPVLGASTVNRKWLYQVNTGTSSAKVWTTCGGVTNSQFNPDNPNWVDNTQQAGLGFKSQNKTGADWSGQVTFERAPQGADPSSYDDAQEYLRLHSVGVFGPGNQVEIRVFEYDPNDPDATYSPRVEAYSGKCGVSWQPAGGDMMADDTVVVNFVSQGALLAIDHPYPVGGSVPVIDSVSDRNVGTAGGDAITINGRHFNGTTGITVGGTDMTNFTVVTDSLIVATVPAKTAGTAALVVTNATGASTTGGNLTYA